MSDSLIEANDDQLNCTVCDQSPVLLSDLNFVLLPHSTVCDLVVFTCFSSKHHFFQAQIRSSFAHFPLDGWSRVGSDLLKMEEKLKIVHMRQLIRGQES